MSETVPRTEGKTPPGGSQIRAWLTRDVKWVLPAAALIGFASELFMTPITCASRWTTVPSAMAISLSSAAIGAFLAFLFAVPRYPTVGAAAGTKAEGLRYNNNFQEISDWLTKIIIGIGLVRAEQIWGGLRGLTVSLSATVHLPAGYVGCIAVLYLICGFMVGYIWTVQDYARRENQYFETNRRVANQTLATMADSALNKVPDTPLEDLEYWYSRLCAALREKSLDPRVAITKARYDAEIHHKLDDAIATLEPFRESGIISGDNRESDHAYILFWLASFIRRKIDADKTTTGPRNYAPVYELLREAVAIRPDAKKWLSHDPDFMKLNGQRAFDAIVADHAPTSAVDPKQERSCKFMNIGALTCTVAVALAFIRRLQRTTQS